MLFPSVNEQSQKNVTDIPLSAAPTLVFISIPGGEDSDLHQSLLLEGPNAGISEPSSQATGHWQVEKLKKLDRESEPTVSSLPQLGDCPGQLLRPQLVAPKMRVLTLQLLVLLATFAYFIVSQ